VTVSFRFSMFSSILSSTVLMTIRAVWFAAETVDRAGKVTSPVTSGTSSSLAAGSTPADTAHVTVSSVSAAPPARTRS
jgi:hypothetical protein